MFVPINQKTGETKKLAWQYYLLRINGSWPLKSNVHWFLKFLYNLYGFTCIIAFCIFITGSLNYIIKENVLNYQLQGTIIELAITFCLIRLTNFIYRRNDFRQLLNKFYFEIIIEKNEKGSDIVRMFMRPIEIMCISYNLSFLWFATQPVITYYILGMDGEPLQDRILKSYNIEGILPTTLLYMLVIWVTMSTATFMSVEAYLIGFYLSHLVGRFNNLNDEILNVFNDINSGGKIPITNEGVRFLNERLKKLLKKHEQLKLFGEQINDNFSFRYFFLVLSSAILLCLVVFVMYEGSDSIINIMFIFWAIAAIMEQMAVGYIGSELIDLTENISTTYYSCNWEIVLLNPEISNYNKKSLLSDLCTAMMSSTKPIKITGLNFFDLSVITAFNTVRTAISYFMFLNTMKNAPQ